MMDVILEIPKEFESHYMDDKFLNSLHKIRHDLIPVMSVTSNYEIAIMDMLIEAFKKSSKITTIAVYPPTEPFGRFTIDPFQRDFR